MHDGSARLQVGGGSCVEWDYADLSLMEVHPANPVCSRRWNREEGMEWKSLAAEKKWYRGRKGGGGGVEGWMEMSGRVDNEVERAERMTGETENWLKICLYVPVRVCYQRL